MSLRKLTILFVAGTTLFLIGITLAIATRTLTAHYETQEKISTFLNIKRVLGAVDQQLTFLENTSNDWADWDDTYRYVQKNNPEFEAENLQLQTFQGLGIDLMILVNSGGEVIFSGITGSKQELDLTVPPILESHLTPTDLILSPPPNGNARRGLMLINGQPMLIVAHPILKSDQSGPPAGTLILGKFFDAESVNKIGSLLLLTIHSLSVPAIQNNPDYAPILAYQPTESEPYYVNLTPDQVSAYFTIHDFYEQPILLVRVDQYPTIFNNGLAVNNYLAISLIVTALAFGILLFYLIRFNVLDRISRLSQEVVAIGASGDIHARLSIPHKDELSDLARTINNTLSALDRAILQRQESEKRFRTLVESMEEVVFTVDRESVQVKVYTKNPPGELLRAPARSRQPAELEFNLGKYVANHPDLLEQAFQGRSTEYEWSSEQAGHKNHFIVSLSPIYDSQGEITSLVGVSKDITRQKQLEQDLRKRVNELDALYSISQHLLNQVEITDMEKAICKLALDQLGMQAAWIVIPSSDGSTLYPEISIGLDETTLQEIPIYQGEGELVHPAARAFVTMDIYIAAPPNPNIGMLLSAQGRFQGLVAIPLINGDKVMAVLIAVMKDASPIDDDTLTLIRAFMNLSSVAMQNAFLFHQVIKGRERLQAVSRRLIEVQEQERHQIALELHDEIGQILTSLRLSIDLIKTISPQKIESQVDASDEIINDLIGRVRQMSMDLRPSMLDDLGIIQTLIWFFDRYTRQTGIQINFLPNNLGRQRFSPNLEITAYRVVQEALTNVARHAKVNSVTVCLWCNERILGIQIEDHGVGFDVDVVFSARNSKGLLGMSERINYIGGRMDIVSEPGEGTNLTVELPVEGRLERRKNGR